MGAGNRLCQLIKKRLLNFGKFGRVHYFEDVFNLVQEHDFFCAVDLRPVSQQTQYDFLGQCGVLFQELHNTVRQLRVIHAEALDFVKWNQHTREEQFVFFLKWESETVDDGAEYLQQFGNSIESFRFVNKLEKYVVDGAANEGSQVEKFAINSVQGRLEEISLARIF